MEEKSLVIPEDEVDEYDDDDDPGYEAYECKEEDFVEASQ